MPREVLEYFKDLTGINLFVKEEIVENKIKLFCSKEKIDESKLLELLNSDLRVKEKFIEYFTVNETYFFREYKQIEEFANEVIKNNRYVEILSMACSSGEEVYTIAITLLERGFKNFKITGVDINKKVIEHAKKGIYKSLKFRKTPKEILLKYFQKTENGYKINDEVKKYTKFLVANIFDDEIFKLGKFDYVFCRNFLIYLDKEHKQKAIEILNRLKKPEGKLFFGHADLY